MSIIVIVIKLISIYVRVYKYSIIHTCINVYLYIFKFYRLIEKMNRTNHIHHRDRKITVLAVVINLRLLTLFANLSLNLLFFVVFTDNEYYKFRLYHKTYDFRGIQKIIQNEEKMGIGKKYNYFYKIIERTLSVLLIKYKKLNSTSSNSSSRWVGLPMLIIFCLSIGYSGIMLGNCWVILEERWPEYKKPTRQPYMEIAYRSFGNTGKRSNHFRRFRRKILYLLLLTSDVDGIFYCVHHPHRRVHEFSCAESLHLCFYNNCCNNIDTSYLPKEPLHTNPTFTTFSMGFGTIMAAFGGASIFPTIQNDMKERTQFWKSVILAFIALLMLYLPVTVVGYWLIGTNVPGNIALYRGTESSLAIKIAIGFEIVHLLGAFLILLNPVCQIFEETLKVSPIILVGIPLTLNGVKLSPGTMIWLTFIKRFKILSQTFTFRECLFEMCFFPSVYNISFFPQILELGRVLVRTSLVAFELIIALGIPNFNLILGLIGGSTITLCSFIAPSSMYMKLVNDQSNPQWPQRTIPTWSKIFLYEIIIIGIIGGICSTGTAVYEIINSDFSSSCFADYFQTKSIEGKIKKDTL
ncbi:hypothetical protein Anas_03094 [Armadillidium nasatum]|uniref:Amino acid transporter transmembrane domain-containing protein n=1 Tax=Armadillidium nasatum TaxID=96803 RepID=A0A5N5T2G1_9CRUS|nr:hypothetical protein Anas_03094 [Armadillidium nasatum]